MSESGAVPDTGELKEPETAVASTGNTDKLVPDEQVERHALIKTARSQSKRGGPAPRMNAAVRCDLGAVRDRNEDYCLSFVSEAGGHFSVIPFGLFIVADGMGGHSNGHVASNVAARVAARHILDKIYLPLLHSPGGGNQTSIQEVLVSAVKAANKAVLEDDPGTDSGTTLTIALVLQRRLYVAHVGDSRLYILADGKLEAITEDHSLVQRLKDVGELTAEEAAVYRYKNVLLRAVGQEEDLEADTYMRLLPKHGKLLVCSDGLCGFVSDDDIQKIMERDLPLPVMVDTLYDTAMEAGGYDNITAVVVQFDL